MVAAAFINTVFAWLGDVVGMWLGADLEHKGLGSISSAASIKNVC